MYSEKKSVLQLVALLKAHDILHVVLSPGSRNAPLIHSLATDRDFTCYSIVDERSAGFFALGVSEALQRPVAVCCTSGTAALNLAPAVAEAFYQQLPLLVITADRPPAWIGQMDGQTIPQTALFGRMVRHSVQLPQVRDSEEEWYCNRLINEAILSLDNWVKGPAHINIPLSEPLFGFTTPSLPPVRVIRRPKQDYRISEERAYRQRFGRFTKKMIIVGQLPPENGLADLLERLRKEQGVVVLADHLSNMPSGETSRFDVLLRTATAEELQELTPELVVTLGGHVVSKRLKQFIRTAAIREQWHISPAGEVTDTFQQVTDIVRSDYETFLRYLTEIPYDTKTTLSDDTTTTFNSATTTSSNKPSTAFAEAWKNACAAVTAPETAFSDLYAVGALMRCIPSDATLQLSNSHSVYLAQLFDLPSSVHRFCNRGTNGIEGSLSTAVGYAAATKRLTVLLTGDMSFFYDMNGLWNRHLTPNLRILLNNNGGGEIFHTLPGLDSSGVLNDYIAAAHSTEASAWAEQQGFLCLTARNEEELQQQLPVLMNRESDKPVLLEVFTSMEENRKVIASYYQHLKNNPK